MRLIHAVAAGALLSLPAIAAAHVTVWPKQSAAEAHEKYVVRVPNEKLVDTIAVYVRFPAGLQVKSFEQKPGWMTEPMRDASGKTVGARWTGRLPAGQFVEFGVLAVNPASPGELSWTAVQTYADRTSVEWSGPKGSKTPGPLVTIMPVAK